MKSILLYLLLLCPTTVLFSQPDKYSQNHLYLLDEDLRSGYDSIHYVYKWEYSNITHAFKVLGDDDLSLNLDSVRLPLFQNRFIPIKEWSADTNRALDPEFAIWMHSKIKGSSQKVGDYLFQAGDDLIGIHEIDIYSIDVQGNINHQRTGSSLAPHEKEIRDVLNFFILSLSQDQVVDLYIRLRGFPSGTIPRLSIHHLNKKTMRELGGCLLKSDFRTMFSGERLRHYTKYNRSIEHIIDRNYSFNQVVNTIFWDEHAQFNHFQEYPMKETFWLRVNMINTTPYHEQFFFYLQKWTHIDLFLPDEHGVYQAFKSGTWCSLKKKIYRDALNFFHLKIPAGDSIYVYARVNSIIPSLSLPISQEFAVAQVNKQAYFEAQNQNSLYILFQGYLLAAFILGFAVYMVIRDPLAFYFSICVLGNLLYTVAEPPGDILYVVIPQLISINGLFSVIYSLLISYGGIKFVSLFIGLYGLHPYSRKFINTLFWLLLIVSILLVIISTFWFEITHFFAISTSNFIWVFSPVYNVFAMLYAIGYFLIFFIPLYGLIKKVKYSGILLFSTIVPALSTTLFCIILFIIPLDQEFRSFAPLVLGVKILPWFILLQFGVFIFVTVFAVLIGLKGRDYSKERQSLLEAQLKNEQKVAHKLRKLDALKDQFLANTSHELRTPLQGIIGLSESLLDREKMNSKKEDLSMIISSGKRLNSLVNDILDFSKLKHFDIELLKKPIDLHSLVDVILRNNAVLIRDRDLKLINQVGKNLPAVLADENRLQQILYNLVGNAIKFTEAGYVKIDAQVQEDIMMISVEDTGIGIPEDKIKTIFDEFEQADASDSRTHGGTGLGLSITKQLVELHGGTISVKSKVSSGSTFQFTLPISHEKPSTLPLKSDHDDEVQSDLVPQKLSATQESTEKIQILIVDDEPINQQVLKNYLSQDRYQITRAMNGEEALAYLEKDHDFDLILLDIMMPKMSGYEVCEIIRNKYLPSELPVIMITAKNQVQDLVQGLALGANDYITKPFSKDEFLARINTQLDLSRIFEITGRFVPNAFIRSLGKSRITEVAIGDHTEQDVTVLFADIRDYTSLAELMTPEETYKFIKAFHGRLGPIIQKFDGFVNQYLGDAIMAIFPNHAKDALLSAIEMQLEIQKYNQDRQTKKRKPISIGIGVHSGSLIMGIIGDAQRMDAATIADTVNTASRIESLTKHYHNQIILSENSYVQISDQTKFCFRALGKVIVKGKNEPLGIYECFDGDSLSNKQFKKTYGQQFERGLDLYFSKEFAKASVEFQEILNINPKDLTAQLFRDKAAKLTYQGVSDDWDGVEKMETK